MAKIRKTDKTIIHTDLSEVSHKKDLQTKKAGEEKSDVTQISPDQLLKSAHHTGQASQAVDVDLRKAFKQIEDLNKQSEDLKSGAKTPEQIAEEIARQVQAGQLSPEDGEALKAALLSGAHQPTEAPGTAPGTTSAVTPGTQDAPGADTESLLKQMDPQSAAYFKAWQAQQEKMMRQQMAMQQQKLEMEQRLQTQKDMQEMLLSELEHRKTMENMVRAFIKRMHQLEVEMRQAEFESNMKIGLGWMKALGG